MLHACSGITWQKLVTNAGLHLIIVVDDHSHVSRLECVVNVVHVQDWTPAWPS